jgi:plastocyanin
MRPVFLVVVSACVVGATAALAAQHVVNQVDKQFAMAELTVKVGESVEFKNVDKVAHNVMSRSKGNTFNLGSQKPGDTSSHTFETAGKVKVRCAIHPKMKMTINVVE